MPHKTSLILVFCAVAIQQQFLIALAGEQKLSAEPIKLADLNTGPYRSDVAPISNLEKSDNPHEFATKLKLIIAQSDFEKNYGSYGKKTTVICNLDKSDDPQVFENELNKIVAQSDFEKHIVSKDAPESKDLTIKLQNVPPLGPVYSSNGSDAFVPQKPLVRDDQRPANILEDVKLQPTKYLAPY